MEKVKKIEKFDYSNAEKILSVKSLEVNFRSDSGMVHAVRGVSFDLYKGETLCIVGESGSGKSVTNKAIMGILPGNAIIANGQIMYEGEDLVRISEDDFHRIRGNKIGMIFQDPLSALNPIMKVGKQITEAMLINSNILKKRYSDLIMSDLTALRNVKANSTYEAKKIKTEVSLNARSIKNYKTCKKKLKNPKLKIEEKNKILDKFDRVTAEIDSYLATFVRRFATDIDYLNGLIKHNNERIDVLGKTEVKDNVSSELRIQKRNNKNTCIQKEIDLLNKYKEFDYTTDRFDGLAKVDEYLKEKQLLMKANLKFQEPVLKEILSLRKKYAHQDVAEYKAKIEKEHDEKVAEQKVLLAQVEEKIQTLRNSLSEEERNRIDSIISKNEAVLKKQAKMQGKFQENNLSKIDSSKRFVPVSIEHDDYEALLKEKAGINKKISDIDEELINKTKITKAEAKKKALKVMKEVGIPLPERRYKQYPFEFSGGMRQRIVIAIALTADPDILICDEPTTALDVTIQAQILELINKLKRERHLSCIFITHDLGVVANMADRVAVMYAGKIVEYGKVNEIFYDPKHPYTWALLSSIPDINSKEKLESIPGTPPDMVYPPKGDAFALRNKYALAIDFKAQPPFFKVSDTHYAATWLLYPGAPKVEVPAIVRKRIESSKKKQEEIAKNEKASKE